MKDIPIAFIDDDGTTYESENFVDFKVKEKEEEIEKLNYIIDKQDRDIVSLSNGNRKLKDKILKLETDVSIYKNLSNLRQERIDEAIGYIKNNCYIETTNEYMKYGDDLSPKYLIDILQGSDKE